MQYIIDGYNLLYQTDLSNREELIKKLVKFCHASHNTAKIIFDGLATPEFYSTRVQVVYAGNADHEIEKVIQEAKTPSFYTLVTSDKELVFLARQKGIKNIKVEDFNFDVNEEISEQDDKPTCFLSDEEVNRQLKEFNYFKT